MAVNPSYGGAMSGLARALVQHGRLPENVAEELTAQARNHGSGFIEQLVTSRKMSTLDVAEFASRTFGLPLLDLEALDTSGLPLDLVDKKLMRERRVLPLRKRGNRLAVAVSDPSNTQVLDEVKFQTSMSIDAIVVEDDKLRTVLTRVLERAETSLKQLIDEDLSVEFTDDEAQKAAIDAAASEVDDAPVVKFIQKVHARRDQRRRLRHPLRALRDAFTGSASASTASCARSRSRRSSCARRSPRASR